MRCLEIVSYLKAWFSNFFGLSHGNTLDEVVVTIVESSPDVPETDENVPETDENVPETDENVPETDEYDDLPDLIPIDQCSNEEFGYEKELDNIENSRDYQEEDEDIDDDDNSNDDDYLYYYRD